MKTYDARAFPNAVSRPLPRRQNVTIEEYETTRSGCDGYEYVMCDGERTTVTFFRYGAKKPWKPRHRKATEADKAKWAVAVKEQRRRRSA